MTGGPSGQRSGGQYLVGLCLAVLGVSAAGWLVVTALAFAGPAPGTRGGRWSDAAVTTLATGVALALVAAATFACWARAWRRALRADGVLAGADGVLAGAAGVSQAHRPLVPSPGAEPLPAMAGARDVYSRDAISHAVSHAISRNAEEDW